MASPVSAWIPDPPGEPALEAPSPQLVNALCNEMETPVEFGPDFESHIERVAFVMVAFDGIELRSNAINPRRRPLLVVSPVNK